MGNIVVSETRSLGITICDKHERVWVNCGGLGQSMGRDRTNIGHPETIHAASPRHRVELAAAQRGPRQHCGRLKAERVL